MVVCGIVMVGDEVLDAEWGMGHGVGVRFGRQDVVFGGYA